MTELPKFATITTAELVDDLIDIKQFIGLQIFLIQKNQSDEKRFFPRCYAFNEGSLFQTTISHLKLEKKGRRYSKSFPHPFW